MTMTSNGSEKKTSLTTNTSIRVTSKTKKDDDEGMLQYFYNPRNGKVLGRTGKECFQLTVFYIILYLILAALWTLLLLGFYQTLDEHRPKYTLGESLIGTNPGLDFRPRPTTENADSTIIWLAKNPKERNYWVENLITFLKPYREQPSLFSQTCKGSNAFAEAGKFCYFDITKINKDCSQANDFGYRKGAPCVLLKLNRIFDWIPQPFKPEDLVNFSKIPEEVRKQYLTRKIVDQLIYITCQGENISDREALGPIKYYPEQGVPFRHFPYTNQPGFLSPFVMIHFVRPVHNLVINIECKAWAKNIIHSDNRMERHGSVHFQLLIDD